MEDNPQPIINELLASAIHAIITAKLNPEIVAAFTRFYDGDKINQAKNCLMDLELIPRRSLRQLKDQEAREKSILEIIQSLRKTDWQGNDQQFAAVDLGAICRVPSALGDEIQLRSEVDDLKRKFEDLTAAFEEVKHARLTVERAIETVVSYQNSTNEHETSTQAPDSQIMHLPNNIAAPPPVRSESPILYSQIAALARHATSEQQTTTVKQDNDGFTKVTRRRTLHGKAKHNVVVGGLSNSQIKSVAKKRLATVFMTRCSPESDEFHIQQHAIEHIIHYPLLKVEPLKTKADTYKSFKLIFDLREDSLSNFFRQTLIPTLWPSGALVKPFSQRKPSAHDKPK